jgi:TadE-like protein
MCKHKRSRGQGLLEFIGTAPLLLALFFLIMATAVVWMQHTNAQRLAFEGARLSCAGAATKSQPLNDWSKSWPEAPGMFYSHCEKGRCEYRLSSNYTLAWLGELFSNKSGVSILGRSACPRNEFFPPTESLW